MILRNNSKNEWLNYHNGIDVKAESTFEVPEKEGNFILKMLGHENWVVKVEADEVIEKINNSKLPKTIVVDEKVKVQEKLENIVNESKPLKRTEIMKSLKEKGIKFKASMKNSELLELLK